LHLAKTAALDEFGGIASHTDENAHFPPVVARPHQTLKES
jgi:hypothetical protein